MDIKTILQNPQRAAENHCDDTDTAQVVALAGKIKSINKHSKEIKTEKQLCARQFKNNKDKPEQLAVLKEEMQAISSQLDSLNTQGKSLEKELLQHFTNTKKATAAQLPTQFQQTNCRPKQQTDQVVLIESNRANDWNLYVEQHPNASQYHFYIWRHIIEQSFGHNSFYFAALNTQGDIIGILPSTWLNSRLFGSFAVSMPYFNYGGPLADNSHIAQDLMNYMQAIATREHWGHAEVRTTTPNYHWPSESRKVSMIRPLPKSEPLLDQEIGAKVRAQIKRGDHYNPQITFGQMELLDDYYRVFSTHMRDLGTPVYHKKFFANILTALPKNTHIAVVSVNNEPVAAAFLIGHREMMEIPWASTLSKANPMNINMWMYRRILGFAIKKGYSYFDFGRSTVDANTYRFKKQWGAKPVAHHWYYWMSNKDSLPELNPDNPKYKLLISTWKKLPLIISNFVGPYVVKNLP